MSEPCGSDGRIALAGGPCCGCACSLMANFDGISINTACLPESFWPPGQVSRKFYDTNFLNMGLKPYHRECSCGLVITDCTGFGCLWSQQYYSAWSGNIAWVGYNADNCTGGVFNSDDHENVTRVIARINDIWYGLAYSIFGTVLFFGSSPTTTIPNSCYYSAHSGDIYLDNPLTDQWSGDGSCLPNSSGAMNLTGIGSGGQLVIIP